MKTLKNTHKITQATGVITSALAVTLSYTSGVHASAADELKKAAGETGQGGGVTVQAGIEIVSNILLFLIGLAAVIMIIIGGIRYTTSNGDPSQTKAAKDTILYAVIGIVVALMAFAIVRFVVDRF
ncbi:MAG: hypothetical protein UY35_C0009G0022 [Candidatus Saccharibacteria bacterium GW2011_GWC2_48_9]|nr:MAG: hypothetical protein UY35_C0009G0022 [Candidatus Saccharibacteria bacterium GW2011_GWC2_48_9]HCH34077.1 hypothetical protein [Candidatus Saccharibacteria bacterium]